MTDTMTSQNTDLSSWDTQYKGQSTSKWLTWKYYGQPVGLMGPWNGLLLKSVVVRWGQHYEVTNRPRRKNEDQKEDVREKLMFHTR